MAFRRRYNLAPTDPRFLDATPGQIITDYWANYYHDNPNKIEDEDEDFDLDAEVARIEAENEAKAAAETGSVDDWEDVSPHGPED